MASEKSTTADEYATLNFRSYEGMNKKFFPCNISVLSICFQKSTVKPSGNVGIYSSVKEIQNYIKTLKVPLIMLCITQQEANKFKLAKELLEQPCVFKWTGPNTFYADKHIFTDIIFETGAK